MKIKLAIVSLVCLTALCLSVPALAQEDLSLVGLSEQLQALTDKVTALTERIDSIEALWINSTPTVLLDGSCLVGSKGGMQDSSVLSYKETFDEWPNTNDFQVAGVNYNPETGIIGVQYEELFTDQSIIEFWQGCEFLENTDWWEADYNDKPFEGYVVPTE